MKATSLYLWLVWQPVRELTEMHSGATEKCKCLCCVCVCVYLCINVWERDRKRDLSFLYKCDVWCCWHSFWCVCFVLPDGIHRHTHTHGNIHTDVHSLVPSLLPLSITITTYSIHYFLVSLLLAQFPTFFIFWVKHPFPSLTPFLNTPTLYVYTTTSRR